MFVRYVVIISGAQIIKLFKNILVRPTGVEPISSASEADALSIELRAQNDKSILAFITLPCRKWGEGEEMIKLFLLIILLLVAGSLSGLFVSTSIDTWYLALNKPFFNPPNFLFAPIWTILYILLAVYIWRISRLPQNKLTREARALFVLQLILNLIWTPLFFGLRSILFGLIDIIVLDVFVLRMLIISYKADKTCFWLLSPYALWLGYATVLNISLQLLN